MLLGLASCACGAPKLPTLEHGAEAVQMTDPTRFHEREGYWRIVTPAHIPSSAPDVDQVEVWLSLGEGEITSEVLDDGRRALAFPIGTRADRVESAGRGANRFIADVRGTTLTAAGPRFHVYRPSAGKPDAPLFGAAWPADAPKGHEAATDYIATQMAKSALLAGLPAARRDAEVAAFRSKNACLPCHDPGRRDNETPGQFGLVNRGTDASGFFTPATAFADEVPLEQYGLHDRTASDPLVEIVCGEEILSDAARQTWDRTCPQGRVPRARWSWSRAWAEAPTRAKARCDLAERLFSRMDAETRGSVETFFDNCSKRPEDSE